MHASLGAMQALQAKGLSEALSTIINACLAWSVESEESAVSQTLEMLSVNSLLVLTCKRFSKHLL